MNKKIMTIAVLILALMGLFAIIKPSTVARQDIIMPTVVTEEAAAPIIDKLMKADYGDVIVLHVSGYGGDVATGLMLDAAMKESKAHVIYRVEGLAMSMYADLAAHAKNVEFSDQALVMFHGVQTSNGPLPADDPMQIYFTNRDAQSGLFTNEEVCEMRHGKEIYMDEKEFEKRAEHRAPFEEATCGHHDVTKDLLELLKIKP